MNFSGTLRNSKVNNVEDVTFKMDLTNDEKTKKGPETFYYNTLEFVLPQIKKHLL